MRCAGFVVSIRSVNRSTFHVFLTTHRRWLSIVRVVGSLTMIKPDNPAQLAIDILARSTCHIKVGAAITDSSGRIVSWGWNSVGSTGFGEHAECAAIRRANKKRIYGGTIYVASQRRRNSKTINSRPCLDCERLIQHYLMTSWWRGPDDNWYKEYYL